MRVNFGNRIPIIVGQTADAMRDMQLMLSDDGGARVAQQLVVMQQRTGNRILDSKHTYRSGVLLDAGKHLFESRTTD
jgi:hypothetical protein